MGKTARVLSGLLEGTFESFGGLKAVGSSGRVRDGAAGCRERDEGHGNVVKFGRECGMIRSMQAFKNQGWVRWWKGLSKDQRREDESGPAEY